MTSSQLLIVLLGAVIGGGIALLIHSLQAVEVDPNQPVTPSSLLPTLKNLGTRLPLAIAAGVVVLLLTRWVVLGGATASDGAGGAAGGNGRRGGVRSGRYKDYVDPVVFRVESIVGKCCSSAIRINSIATINPIR